MTASAPTSRERLSQDISGAGCRMLPLDEHDLSGLLSQADFTLD